MDVLLIEDDIQLNKTISTFLELKKYHLTSTTDGNEGIQAIDEKSFDLFIIDINLPNISGLELTTYIRNKYPLAPIIIITASLEIDNFIKAFENGCNEYIKKPFHLKELEVRINKLLPDEQSLTLINNNIKYHQKFKELFVDDKKVDLRKKEHRLLDLLIQHANHTVDTETLISYVWEDAQKENYPIRQLVNELRKKLQDKEIISTDIGLGYRLNKQ